MGFEFMFAKYLQIRIPRLSGHVLRGGGGMAQGAPETPDLNVFCQDFKSEVYGIRSAVQRKGRGGPRGPGDLGFEFVLLRYIFKSIDTRRLAIASVCLPLGWFRGTELLRASLRTQRSCQG